MTYKTSYSTLNSSSYGLSLFLPEGSCTHTNTLIIAKKGTQVIHITREKGRVS